MARKRFINIPRETRVVDPMTPDKHVLGEHFKFSQMPREAVAGTIVAFTDGSCFPNPGPGGWGVRMIWGEWGREAYGGAEEQTNNTMELTAVRIALGLRVKPPDTHADLHGQPVHHERLNPLGRRVGAQ
jgi:hypothetical protein